MYCKNVYAEVYDSIRQGPEPGIGTGGYELGTDGISTDSCRIGNRSCRIGDRGVELGTDPCRIGDRSLSNWGPRSRIGDWSLEFTHSTNLIKNMINQVVWIWQYQEPETNKCRKSRRQKWNQNNLGFLVLPKTHLPVSNRAFHLFFILVKHLLSDNIDFILKIIVYKTHIINSLCINIIL